MLVGLSVLAVLPKFFNMCNVPTLSKITSAVPYHAATPYFLQSSILKVLASSAISISIAALSISSIPGLSSKYFAFLAKRIAASCSATAISPSLPPDPVIKNKGNAACPVAANPKDGNKFVAAPATHLPASLALLISSMVRFL